jgi:hypothetical protein
MSKSIYTSLNIATSDAGKVRLGGVAPALSTADIGKVRLGSFAAGA